MTMHSIHLPGWQQNSTWGFNTETHRMYALLYRDSSSNVGVPDHEISFPVVEETVVSRVELCRRIASTVRLPMEDVAAAMLPTNYPLPPVASGR